MCRLARRSRSTTGFARSVRDAHQQSHSPIRAQEQTYAKPRLAVPRHALHHALQPDVVTNQVLVARKEHHRDLLQHARQDRD